MKTIFSLKKNLIKLFTLLCLLPSFGSFAPEVFHGFGQRVNAQTIEILLNSEWYLAESNVNGVSISLENSGVPIFHSPHNENFFLHYYGVSCFESFEVTYTDVTETSFNLSTIIEYVSCNYTDPDEIAAVELYLSFYFELPFNTNSTPRNPFSYEWVDGGFPVDDLIITNPEGDWLLYRTAFLSTPTFHQNSFALYPNPVNETLQINNTSNQVVAASLYDLNGKLLQSHSLENSVSPINVSALTHGLYFVVLVNEQGDRVSKKFIKN
ncbi:T9SS type A sorting domain-containing protein [Planktosalinus lacus]|uniref:Secretion system C-terminal sorting domain-containing protein n=1 Tax=Planktosalinus lacus TaxID=1526573 RepID=A0A8J2V4S5_9FLAO|nr:T9SS type A sorting domain-containing protein [Planktosalinus lacus]GGD82073.1 hypothetical protein GCM10011312_03020 [Planktosalinus lacus]